MKRQTALCVVLALLVAVSGVPAAAAQEDPRPTTTEEETTEEERDGTRIDSGLRLVSSSYDGSGTATLVFETDGAKAVTLADAGGFMDGGQINRRTLVLEEGGTHTVEFQVTESERGYVGVSIATNEVLYGKVIEEPTVSPILRRERHDRLARRCVYRRVVVRRCWRLHPPERGRRACEGRPMTGRSRRRSATGATASPT